MQVKFSNTWSGVSVEFRGAFQTANNNLGVHSIFKAFKGNSWVTLWRQWEDTQAHRTTGKSRRQGETDKEQPARWGEFQEAPLLEGSEENYQG